MITVNTPCQMGTDCAIDQATNQPTGRPTDRQSTNQPTTMEMSVYPRKTLLAEV